MFYVYSGERDSVKYELKHCDTLTNILLNRKKTGISETAVQPTKKTKSEKELARKELRKRKLLGYDDLTKTYSKNLNFMGSDSSIAVMKINDFAEGKYRRFYSNSFKQLDSLKTNTLILDLRDNPGGNPKDISNLYSYLTNSSFNLIDKMEITSRASLVLGSFSKGTPFYLKALFFTIGSPYLLYTIIRVKKEGDRFYYPISQSKLRQPNPLNFKGKVYVLINGGTFSASSIISSNLKGSKRAIFVGEETGGAYNGCIAGRMPTLTLPESKLKIRFGLCLIQPHYKTDLDGRGILPDIEICPTLEDRINGNDPELNWVFDEIKGKHKNL